MSRTRYAIRDGSIARARELRREATPPERALWAVLRASGLEGAKFRRQQRIGRYFADFVCQACRLVIEVDGGTHVGEAAEQHDRIRDAFLESEGYRVIRFSNHDVLDNLDGVVLAIRAALTPSPSPAPAARGPLPLPQGERGE